MACRLALPFWPTSLDCVSWSKDNIIAVAGGEQVAFLSPRLKDLSNDNLPWDVIIVRVSAFNTIEIPLQQPLSSANFSVGEELSTRQVLSLQWSSPGLGKYGSCVLAVLTTDHVLSIWECEGRPNVVDDWKRRVIANHAVRGHYKRMASLNSSSEWTQTQREQHQVQQRVRAFTWSPPLYRESAGEGTAAFRDRGHQFLAVSTEAGDILLLRVQSPHDILRPLVTDWSIKVMQSFDVQVLKAMHAEPSHAASMARASGDKKIIANYLAWGPWRWDTDVAAGNVATLAYIANGMLFTAEVLGGAHSPLPEARRVENLDDRHHIVSRRDVTGPLAFCTGTDAIVVVATDRIYCLSSLQQEDQDNASHHLDGRWDDVSGLAFTGDGENGSRVHLVSHLSSAIAETTTLTIPSLLEADTSPEWQTAINDERASYGIENDLDDHVQERTWGIASSPLGDYVATCLTFHPSNAVSYITQSHEQCVLSITRDGVADQDIDSLIRGAISARPHLSADGLFFSIRRHLEDITDGEDMDTLHPKKLAEKFSQVVTAASLQHVGMHADSPVPQGDQQAETLVCRLKLRIYQDPDMHQLRYQTLAAFITQSTRLSDGTLRRVLQHLMTEALRLPRDSLQDGELSRKIVQAYNLLQAKLSGTSNLASDLTGEDRWSEECPVCQQDMAFESVKWVRCSTGHQFPRCALTCLVIPGPGVSKQCNVCAAQYLDETKLPGLARPDDDIDMVDLPAELVVTAEHSTSDQQIQAEGEGWVEVSKKMATLAEPPTSLARILFAACDTCIYCGGRLNV